MSYRRKKKMVPCSLRGSSGDHQVSKVTKKQISAQCMENLFNSKTERGRKLILTDNQELNTAAEHIISTST